MTVKKYELTDDTMEFEGSVMHRIRALIDIPAIGVSAGDLGGYVESEDNLSHEGNCWVFMDAVVEGKALVKENAVVKDNAVVGDKATVRGNAVVEDHAVVKDNAIVGDKAVVRGNAVVDGYAFVKGNVVVEA